MTTRPNVVSGSAGAARAAVAKLLIAACVVGVHIAAAGAVYGFVTATTGIVAEAFTTAGTEAVMTIPRIAVGAV